MDGKRKSEYIGVLGALLVHVAFIALLILVSFTIPQQDEDAGGVPVMMGDVDSAHGDLDPSLVDVEMLPEEASPAEPTPEAEQEIITQTEEETVAIKPKNEPKKEKPKPVKKPEKTAEQKAADAKKLAEEKAEQERKAAEKKINDLMSNSFNKGSTKGESRGGAKSGDDSEGASNGNPISTGKSETEKNETFDLGGRSIIGSLPRPVYNVQEEGIVVVSIVVSPQGKVIKTRINLRTNTSNPVLRQEAEKAAKKALFEAVDRVDNQPGTITYFFKLK